MINTYCENEIWDAIQDPGAYDQKAREEWKVEIDTNHAQPLLEEIGGRWYWVGNMWYPTIETPTTP